MNSIRFKQWMIGISLVLATGLTAHAEDTDLFAGVTPDGANAPHVLFVIDNAASFSANNPAFRCNISSAGVVKTDGTGAAADFTPLDGKNAGVEQCALYTVVKSLAESTTTIKVGVMFFNAGMKTLDPATNTFGAECAGGEGGCLALKILTLNSSTAPRVLDWIRKWNSSGAGNYNIKGSANRGDGATMQEAWAYFFGKTGISGRDYSTIAPASGCASKHIIFMGNNWSTQTQPKDATTNAASPKLPFERSGLVSSLKWANPAPTILQRAPISDTLQTVCGIGTLDTAENKGAYGLNWVRYMKAQGVTTYSVALMNAGCDQYYGAYLSKMGSTEIGGGKFFSVNNYDELVASLKTALGEIQSVNSVFAAVSLPVSVNSQGSYLNQVYVGMFRPAKTFFPRWDGNLKQYKLGFVNGSLVLQDADNKGAINSLTGFITECARSYWTPNTIDTYWEKNESGGCLTIDGAKTSNFPDGNIVEKGAQAYKLRGITPTARTMKTCLPGTNCTSLTDFTTANSAITQLQLNPLGTDRDTLINWARGTNTVDELDKGTTVMRPSSHGDVVHSRPIPLNHGTDAVPSIVVYYGGNDGVLRAVNGNRGSATDPALGRITSDGKNFDAGTELWSFMPPEFYGSIKRLYDNTVPVSFPNTPSTTARPKDYGIDGPITAFHGTVAGVDKKYVYATMRRGGRAIYAFDVTVPGTPTLLWKKGCPNAKDDVGCSTDYEGMGQTWASLKPFNTAGYGSGTSSLLITGGGYDPCEDSDARIAGGPNHSCTALTKGNKVYVIDAVTGLRVKAFDTDRAVIADSTLVRDSSGMVKHAYTADMGGNVYRMDFGSGAASSWTIKKIASFGCETPGTCTANRKFMFAPTVSTTDGVTYFVGLGSGDREKPVVYYAAATAVTNYFFMFRDVPTDPASTTDTANCGFGTTLLCKASMYGITTAATPTESELGTKKGWYLGLSGTEQVVTSAITVFGVVTFSTHQPAVYQPNTCTPNLGTTRVYNVGYKNAISAAGARANSSDASRYDDLSGDGLPPSPVAGQVKLDDGTVVPFCIGCSPKSPLEGSIPAPLTTVIQPKNRLYWYIEK